MKGKVPISKIGTSNRQASRPLKISNAGFTLIELIVIIMILGMTAFLVIPRISAFHAGEMKWTARHLANLIQQLTQDSALTKERYRLYFNLDTEEYWTVLVQESIRESDQVVVLSEKQMIKKNRLPTGISFEDVITAQKGKVAAGEVFSEFYPVGIEPFTIHLAEGESKWTLVANPLTGRVKMFEEYSESPP